MAGDHLSQLQGDLERVGFKVTAKPTPVLPDYYGTLPTGRMQVFLFADYSLRGTPEDLPEPFEAMPATFGPDDPELLDSVQRASTEVDGAKRTFPYENANRLVMESLPVVPFAHVKTVVALSPRVKGFRIGLGGYEPDFTAVTLS